DDGVFDICIVGEVSRLRIFPLILRFIKGNQEGHTAVKYEQGRRIRVTAGAQDTLPAHGDGETLCKDGRELTLDLFNNQLQVLSQASAG
ncbi:MAG: diacylglycerol kinase family lipid kinase, partial [Anaerolineae bacterium]|nr:diacylglycerol kinase family lipid kinase [Anaerolineae bacterium]